MMEITRMNQTCAPLRFICPTCTSPLPTRAWRRLPGWRGILLAVCIGLFIDAVGFQLEPASLVTLKVALMTTQTILIDFLTASKAGSDRSIPRYIYHRAGNRSLTTQNAINRLACIINHRDDPRVIHMAWAKDANRPNDRPVIIPIRRNHQ